jgi:DNA-binding beta-propeller fold protein YncE
MLNPREISRRKERQMNSRALYFAPLVVCLFLGTQTTLAQVPSYKFDPEWPKLPLPNQWWMQGVTGLYVDNDDNIWVLNRPSNLSNTENYAQLDPPAAECCVAPPAIVAFDNDGNVIQSWDTPEGHGMMVDADGYVWIGSDTVRKYTAEGKLIAAIERIPEDEAPEGKYSPDVEVIVDQIEEVRADEAARELYTIDNYLNGRVMVYDMDTLEFKRGWGAYGKHLSRIVGGEATDGGGAAYYSAESADRETGTQAADFVGHVTIGLSVDGLVYVADRRGNRIQVFTKQGEFQKEFFLAVETRQRGSTGGIAFSHDAEQQYLIVPDIQNNTIWILNREDGTVVSRVGSAGNNGGQFHGLHMVDVDSKGNIYTGEVHSGERVQRFILVD